MPRLLAAVRAISPPALILFARYTPADTESVVYSVDVARFVATASCSASLRRRRPAYWFRYRRRHDARERDDRDASRTDRAADSRRHASENIPIEPVPLSADLRLATAAALGIDHIPVARGSGCAIQTAERVASRIAGIRRRRGHRGGTADAAYRRPSCSSAPDGVWLQSERLAARPRASGQRGRAT